MKVVLVSAVLGIVSAALIIFFPNSDRPGITSLTQPTDTGSWGSLSVEQVRKLAQLRALRVETSTLEWAYRKEPRPYTLDRLYRWRNLAVVVPVSCELGVKLDDIEFRQADNGWKIEIPRASILSVTPMYGRERMLIWKDEGNSFKEDDLFSETIRGGEEAAKRKCEELGMLDRATDATVATLRSLAALAGIPERGLIIEVKE